MTIPHRIRIHPRARHVRLRVDPHQGVIVTIPPGFDRTRVPALLAERSEWLERVQQRLDRQRGQLDPEVAGLRPARIDLAAIGQSWPVLYQRTSSRKLTLQRKSDALQFHVPDQEGESVILAVIGERLRRWLMDQARSHLVSQTRSLAGQHGFRIDRVTIRNQRSRWGSCSNKGNISLNARLLLCSPAACRYVLLHELVHTEHLDHSPAFWQRVAELVPDHRDCSAGLRATWQRLPAWVHATNNNQNDR